MADFKKISTGEKTMETIVKDSTGKIFRQLESGTCFKRDTDNEIIKILEQSRKTGQRIRLFYGDIKTGLDWKEEYDIIGTIGRSTGTIKIPLLLRKNNSYGGSGILTDCIVKITINKKTVYLHKDYHIEKKSIGITADDVPIGYTHGVDIDDNRQANFKSLKQANNYILFLRGIRNKI